MLACSHLHLQKSTTDSFVLSVLAAGGSSHTDGGVGHVRALGLPPFTDTAHNWRVIREPLQAAGPEVLPEVWSVESEEIVSETCSSANWRESSDALNRCHREPAGNITCLSLLDMLGHALIGAGTRQEVTGTLCLWYFAPHFPQVVLLELFVPGFFWRWMRLCLIFWGDGHPQSCMPS